MIFKAFLLALVVSVVLVLIAIVTRPSAAQSSDPSFDPYSQRNVFVSQDLQTFIYESPVDFIVYYQTQNLRGIFQSERIATQREIDAYLRNRASAIEELNREGSKASLIADPEIGQRWLQWVTNRTVALNSCSDDMQAAQTFDFNSLGVNAQNTTISRMQSCIDLNAATNTKTINNLYDLLVSQGLIVVTQ